MLTHARTRHRTIDRLSPPLCLPAMRVESSRWPLSLSPAPFASLISETPCPTCLTTTSPSTCRCLVPRGAGRGGLRLAFSRLPAPHGVIAYPSPLLVNLSYGESGQLTSMSTGIWSSSTSAEPASRSRCMSGKERRGIGRRGPDLVYTAASRTEGGLRSAAR